MSASTFTRARISARWQGMPLLMLGVAATAAAFGRTAVSPLQETMRTALGLSDNQLALLQGPALALPVVMASIPLGLAIDRYSRVRMLLGLSVLDAFGTLLTALAPSFALLFLSRCLVGLSATAISTVAFSLLADLCAPQQRGRATMMVVIGQAAGIAAAFAIGGLLLSLVGKGPSGWRTVMLWLSTPVILATLVAVPIHEPLRSEVAVEKPSARQTWIELWQRRTTIVPLLAGLVTAEIALQAALVWSAPAFARRFGLSPGRIGAIMATALIVSGVVGPVTGGLLADLCQRTGGPRRTLTVLTILPILLFPTCFFAVLPSGLWAGVLLVFFMTAVDSLLVMGTTLFTIVIPNELRGLCMAVFSGASTLLGVGLAPLTVSVLSNQTGGGSTIGRALVLVCASASFFSGVIFALGRRSFRVLGLPSGA